MYLIFMSVRLLSNIDTIDHYRINRILNKIGLTVHLILPKSS